MQNWWRDNDKVSFLPFFVEELWKGMRSAASCDAKMRAENRSNIPTVRYRLLIFDNIMGGGNKTTGERNWLIYTKEICKYKHDSYGFEYILV